MLIPARSLIAVTLISHIWFSGFAGTKAQHETKLTPTQTATPPPLSSITQQAQQGDAKAEYQLGWTYMNGANISSDYHEALKWLRKSAAQGFPDAEFALGYLYEQGKGVKRDYPQAAAYYEAAARQGHPTAENNLSSMYEHGEGVSRDIHRAADWYRRAADHGEVIAQCNLASLYFRGKGIARDYSQAAAWFRAAAERSYAPAQENLAWMYYTGTGVPQDFSQPPNGCAGPPNRDMRARNSISAMYTSKARASPYIMFPLTSKCDFAALDRGEKRAARQLKNLSSLMTGQQKKQAIEASAKLTQSIPSAPVYASSESLGGSFLPPH